jgi:uncharacterized membrane protein YidH (DUF202 family)
MDNQRNVPESRERLGANVWLSGVCILGLAMTAFVHGIHAWDGHSYRAAAEAILDITCIYLLSTNIVRWRRRNNSHCELP